MPWVTKPRASVRASTEAPMVASSSDMPAATYAALMKRSTAARDARGTCQSCAGLGDIGQCSERGKRGPHPPEVISHARMPRCVAGELRCVVRHEHAVE